MYRFHPRCLRLALLCALAAWSPAPVQAEDAFWRAMGGGNFNMNSRWHNSQVPGADDNTIFNLNVDYAVNWPPGFNATNANAWFTASNGVVKLHAASSFWLLTNEVVIGRNPFSTATVAHVSGTLLATNAAGTGALRLGEGGHGQFILAGGAVVADWLYATNNGVGLTNSVLTLSNGTLTTLRGSVVLPPPTNSFALGALAGATAEWMMLGGSNYLDLVQGTVFIGAAPGARGVVRVSGPTTVWRVDASVTVGRDGVGSALIVSNGATFQNIGTTVGEYLSPGLNQAIVTGSGSQLRGVALMVGAESDQNTMRVEHGARVFTAYAQLGASFSGTGNGISNAVIISGSDSAWICTNGMTIGEQGSYNQLWVTNGGVMTVAGASPFGSFDVGTHPQGRSQLVVVSGAGSALHSPSNTMFLGLSGSTNEFRILDGALFNNRTMVVGQNATSIYNTVTISGPGSRLQNTFQLTVGSSGSHNRLLLENGGAVDTTNLVLSSTATASSNLVLVSGGTLSVTNVARSGLLVAGQNGGGLLHLLDGSIVADQIFLTNGAGSRLQFEGGTLSVGSLWQSNGVACVVGSGFTPATLNFRDGGTNLFASGLSLSARGQWIGSGLALGNVTNSSGGTLAPGAPGGVGRFTINGGLVLQAGSTNRFDLHKAAATNDQITGLAGVTYGGRLEVANLGGALALGDRFRLFSAASYNGAFASLALPALPPGLAWSNALSFDGSIEVVVPPPTPYATLVPFGANWRYLDDGSDQGTAWSAPAFDDSSWSNGVAELGYGDGDEATVVRFGPDPNNKHITTYFRHTFTVADPGLFGSLLLRLVRDDGARVFLNGTELLRSNLPEGPIDASTLAPFIIDESVSPPAIVQAAAATALVPGANVLAVEIHQSYSSSSDISFDLQLIAVPANPLAGVTRVWSGAASNAFWSNPTNWQGQAVPQTGDDLVFPAGAARPTSTNDLPRGAFFGLVRFETNGCTLRGGELSVLSGVSNAASSGVNRIETPMLALLGPARLDVPSLAATLVLPAVMGSQTIHCRNRGRLEASSVSGELDLVKDGAGDFRLTSPSYTGETTLNEGTLTLNATPSATSVEINGGATLAGSPFVREILVRSGAISPGSDVSFPPGLGTLSVTNLVFDSAPAVTELRIDATVQGHDLLYLRGPCDLGGARLNLLPQTNHPIGTVLSIVRTQFMGGPITGHFQGLPEGGLLNTSNGSYRISYLGGAGGDITLTRVAHTNVWTGAGGDGLWSNRTNWQDQLLPAGRDALLFPAVASRLMQNDYLYLATPAPAALVFAADGYVLDGYPLAVQTILATHSTGTNRLRSEVWFIGPANAVRLTESNAALAFEGPLFIGGAPCYITNFGRVSITGGIVDAGGGVSLRKYGPGLLEVFGDTAGQMLLYLFDGHVHLNGTAPDLGLLLGNGTCHAAGRVRAISHATALSPLHLGAGAAAGLAGLVDSTTLTLTSNSVMEVDLLGAAAGAGYDQMRIAATNTPVTLTNAALQLNLGYSPALNAQHRIIDNLGTTAVRGIFAGLPEGATLTNQGVVFSITYAGGTGNDVVLTRVNQPMSLGSIVTATNGQVTLTGLGEPGSAFVIECTTNLAFFVWMPVSTNTADGAGQFLFTDTVPTNGPPRFYRARALPSP